MTGLLDWCRENKDDVSSETSLYLWNILEEAPKKPIILEMSTSLFYFLIKRDKNNDGHFEHRHRNCVERNVTGSNPSL